MQKRVKSIVVRIMTVIMLCTTFFSGGATIAQLYGEPTTLYGDDLVNQLVDIAASGTPYVLGGSSRSGVDCSGYVMLAFKELFGTTVAHLESDPSVTFNITGTASYPTNFRSYVGQRIYIEGNGKRMYFTVDACGTQQEYIDMGYGVTDIYVGSYGFSSYFSSAQCNPGSIICYNGHCVVGIGSFSSADDVLAAYPALDRTAAGSEGGSIVRYITSYYNIGNSYSADSDKYNFGKGCYIGAQGTTKGIRTSNASATGKVTQGSPSAYLTVLIPDTEPQKGTYSFIKKDKTTGEVIYDAVYGIYTDSSCTEELARFTTGTDYVSVSNIPYGTYYLKEITAPKGYKLGKYVLPITVSEPEGSMTLLEESEESQLLVKKTDTFESDKSISGASIVLQEWNGVDSYVTLTKPDGSPFYLTYSEVKGGYIISGAYVNVDGTTYTDNALHSNQTNLGHFRVEEVTIPNGYRCVDEQDKSFEAFDITGSESVVLELTNSAAFRLVVNKTDNSGNPLTGATFTFEYNGGFYTFDDMGDGSYMITFPDEGVYTGILRETGAPSGYVIPQTLQAGMTVALSKNTVTTDTTTGKTYFLTSVSVINDTKDAVVHSVKISIRKHDGSYLYYQANGRIYLENTCYSIYTDEACTALAYDKDGNALENLCTDSDGKVVTGTLNAGVYYVKEVQAPEGYAVYEKVYVINATGLVPNIPDSAVVTYSIDSVVYDYRQTAQLSICKTDSASGEPVSGALYGLYLVSDALETTSHDTITASVDSPLLIGYYMTDSNGCITANKFGSKAVGDKAAVTVTTDNGYTAFGGLPTNAVYYFQEITAPEGFALSDEKIYFKPDWYNADGNNTYEGADDYGHTFTVDKYGKHIVYDAADVIEDKQTVTITLTKQDSEKPVYEQYGITETEYDSVNVYSHCATLTGAKYALRTAEDSTLYGVLVPAHTTVATEFTDEDGVAEFTVYNSGTITGTIQSGKYEIVELSPSTGYAISNTVITVDASSADQSLSEFTVNATADEEILKQRLTINKVDGDNLDYGTTLGVENSVFELYSVTGIMARGGSVDNLSRESFAQLIEDGIAVPASDADGNNSWTTDESGNVTTGLLVYDYYVVWEKECDGYNRLAEPTAITLPRELDDTDGITGYNYNFTEQPDADTEILVVNYMDKAFLEIQKYDSYTNELMENVEFTITGSEKTIKVTTDEYGCAATSELLPNGVYTVTEAPVDGYVDCDDTIQITIDESGITAVQGYTYLTTSTRFKDNKLCYTVSVSNTPTYTTFCKMDSETGERIAGASFELLDSKGNVVKTVYGESVAWVSKSDSVTSFYGIPAGEYTVHEISAPFGYAKAADTSITIDNTETADNYFEMSNDRVKGKITINKTDASTGKPLQGVVFGLYVAEDIIDPNTGKIITAKGTKIQELTTDKNGQAFAYALDIGTYGSDFTYIKYMLKELKGVGKYKVDSTEHSFTITYIDNGSRVMEKVFNFTNGYAELTMTKTASPETLVGTVAYDEDGDIVSCKSNNNKGVTVIENGDEIVYTVTVNNIGNADSDPVVIWDDIPENTEFVTAINKESGKKYAVSNNRLTVLVPSIGAGGSFTVEVRVKADCAGEGVIVNRACAVEFSGMTEEKALAAYNGSTFAESEVIATDYVVHQLASLTKTASIEYGSDESTAASVAQGETFTYSLMFRCPLGCNDIVISDQIPDGLTYVEDSIKVTDKNGKELKASAVVNNGFVQVNMDEADYVTVAFRVTAPTLQTATPTPIPATGNAPDIDESVTPKPTAKVTSTPEATIEPVYFINTGVAAVKADKDKNEFVTILSNTVTNKLSDSISKEDAPQTGDRLHFKLWLSMLIMSAIGAAICLCVGTKKHYFN